MEIGKNQYGQTYNFRSGTYSRPYFLARHLLRRMFQYTSRSWISNSMHVTCCVRSLDMHHGWFHSVRFHCWISFICLSRCPTLLHGSADRARRLMRIWRAATVLSVGRSVQFAITSWVTLLKNQRLGGGGMVGLLNLFHIVRMDINKRKRRGTRKLKP